MGKIAVRVVGRSWYCRAAWMLWEAMTGVDSVHVAGSRELCLRSLFLKSREGDWESEFLDSLLALSDHFLPIILSLF